MQEQRKHQRHRVSLNAVIAPMDYRSEEPIDSKAQDISRGGCFIVTRHKFLLGDRIRLEIELPPQHVVSLLCRVIWIRQVQKGRGHPLGVGIEFIEHQPEELDFLEGFLESL